MFERFKVKSEEQQYELDVGRKEPFPVKLEIKKSENLQSVMDKF
jgi:hypothetical protein